MKVLLALSAAALALASPAQATLQIALQVGGDSFFCADNTSCDTNPAVGTVQIADQVIDGIDVHGSIQASVHGAQPVLSTSSLSVTNTTGSALVATVAVSDTNFAPFTGNFATSANGEWIGVAGATANGGFFIDPANAQGAINAFSVPGSMIDSFSATSGALTLAFAHNGETFMALDSPFSMTEQAIFVLPAGEELLNRGQAIVGTAAVPEPSTWALLASGFGLVGLLGMKRRRNRLGEFA
jgi:hypothetical protein